MRVCVSGVTVRQQGCSEQLQEHQELFRTSVSSSFARQRLDRLYGPGELRHEGDNAIIIDTEVLQLAERHI